MKQSDQWYANAGLWCWNLFKVQWLGIRFDAIFLTKIIYIYIYIGPCIYIFFSGKLYYFSSSQRAEWRCIRPPLDLFWGWVGVGFQHRDPKSYSNINVCRPETPSTMYGSPRVTHAKKIYIPSGKLCILRHSTMLYLLVSLLLTTLSYG